MANDFNNSMITINSRAAPPRRFATHKNTNRFRRNPSTPIPAICSPRRRRKSGKHGAIRLPNDYTVRQQRLQLITNTASSTPLPLQTRQNRHRILDS